MSLDTNPGIQESSGSCLLSLDVTQTINSSKYKEDDGGVTRNAKKKNLENVTAELAIVQKQIARGLALTKDRIHEVEKIRRVSKAERKEIRQKIEVYLKCPECSTFMFNPYTQVKLHFTSVHICGHSLCATCLLKAFKDQKEMFDVDDRETWAYFSRHIIRKLKKDMKGNQEMLGRRQQLTTVFHPSKFMPSIYTCPCCDEIVRMRPILNFSLKAVATVLHGDSPVPEPTIWDQYFPRLFEYNKIENFY